VNDWPLVSVVLISFRGKSLLEQFTPSLANQDYPHLEFLAVITDPADGSAEWLQKTYPHWKIIIQKTNEGATADFDRGIRAAKGEFVFSVANDIWFQPDCVSKMVRTIRLEPNFGICTCKVRRMTMEGVRTQIIDTMGGEIDFMGCSQANGILQEDTGQYDNLRNVFFSYGSMMLIRKSVYEETGGYDCIAFALADDIDLCWRSRLLGYQIVIDPFAVVYHRVSSTLSKVDRGQRRFWSERNTLRMLLKNYSRLNLCWIIPCYSLILSLELLFYFCILRWKVGSRVLAAALWNISHWNETALLRREIQSRRKISDWHILQRTNKFPWKLGVGVEFLMTPRQSWKNLFGSRRTLRA
jgi:GT2 family glycosyltransferase